MSWYSLKPLFISKVRVKLLKLLVGQPEELFYVRELVREIGEEINAVRRELQHMEKARMVTKEKRGNRLYYQFNRQYPYFEDLSSMVAKNTGLGATLIKNRSKLGTIKLVMFSLQFVTGQPYDAEAVDVTVIGNVVLPELAALIQTEEGRLGREINYTVLDKQEFVYRKSKRDPFLLAVLAQPRLIIIGSQRELWVKEV